MGAQDLFPRSSVGGSGNRSVCHLNEHFRQHNCLPQRTGQDLLGLHRRVARGLSREPVLRKGRPVRKWHWLTLSGVAVFDRSHYMELRRQLLIPTGDRNLPLQLGPALCTRFWCFSFVLMWGMSGMNPRGADSILSSKVKLGAGISVNSSLRISSSLIPASWSILCRPVTMAGGPAM